MKLRLGTINMPSPAFLQTKKYLNKISHSKIENFLGSRPLYKRYVTNTIQDYGGPKTKTKNQCPIRNFYAK